MDLDTFKSFGFVFYQGFGRRVAIMILVAYFEISVAYVDV
jgi:hypothetical protein